MAANIKCPNCGAQAEADQKEGQLVCRFCGSAIASPTQGQPDPVTPVQDLGYTPDPPPAYSEKREEPAPEPEPALETIVIDGKPVDIPPQVVKSVVETGRKVSRYVILGMAVLMALCSLCFILSALRQ